MDIKEGIRRNFARRACSYDRYAGTQRLMAQGLLALAEPEIVRAGCILEIGCGTGYLTQLLRQLNPAARLVALDLDEALVAQARRRVGHGNGVTWLVADGEALGGAGSFDLIIANATFQWFTRPRATLAAYFQSLNPGGVLAFSTLGPGTFTELTFSIKEAAAWLGLTGRLAIPAQGFVDQEGWSRMLWQAGFTEVRLARESVTANFPSVHQFLKTLQATGATNPQPRAFSPRQLKAMVAAYQQNFGGNGAVPATYEIIWAVARK
jgi:malonyl-CoA O-methyltransferase